MKQKMVHVSFFSFFVSSQEQRQRSESLSTDLEAARNEADVRFDAEAQLAAERQTQRDEANERAAEAAAKAEAEVAALRSALQDAHERAAASEAILRAAEKERGR